MPEPRTKSEPLITEPRPTRTVERTLPPFRVMRAASENTRLMNVALKELQARIHWVLLAMGIALCASAAWFYMNPPLYRSEVSFYVVNPSKQAEKEPLHLDLGMEQSTLLNMATSSAMYDHLIETFDLYTHYGIPLSRPDARASVHSKLSNNILTDRRETDLVTIRVKDQDRGVAAAIANEIFERTRQMYKEELQAGSQFQLRVYEEVLDSLERLSVARADALARSAAELRSTQIAAGNGVSHERLVELEERLSAAVNDVTNANTDLLRQKRQQVHLLAMARDPGVGAVRLKTRAMEDISTSPLVDSILWVTLITIAAGAVVALILLLIIENWMLPVPSGLPSRR